ncbi:MAG: ArsC/Spx/MgsR family protein [Myxococcota bacterium]
MFEVYGVPGCGTLQDLTDWLDDAGVAYALVDHGVRRPRIAKVASWVVAVGVDGLCDAESEAFRALPADRSDWSEQRWIAAMVRRPKMLHPVIERDGAFVSAGFRDEDRSRLERLLDSQVA